MHQHLYYDHEVRKHLQKSQANSQSARLASLASQSRSDPARRKPDPGRRPGLRFWNLKSLVEHIAHAAS
jgi:hypothetical protein